MSENKLVSVFRIYLIQNTLIYSALTSCTHCMTRQICQTWENCWWCLNTASMSSSLNVIMIYSKEGDEVILRVPSYFPISKSFLHNRRWVWQSRLWALCTNMPNSANANCRSIIRTTHAVHVPLALLRIDGAEGDGWGVAGRSQISRKTISIDPAKSVQTDANCSQLWQSMDPPLGSDLHYDDK